VRIALVFLLALWTTHISCGYDTIRQDLSKTWKIIDNGTFKEHSGRSNVIYIDLTTDYHGTLEIKNNHPLSIFVNNRLAVTGKKKIRWPVDSLTMSSQAPLQIAIFSDEKLNDLSTYILYPANENKIESRPQSHRASVITITALLLLVILIILFRTGPQTIVGYFNFIKIFSFRSTDEGVVNLRATSFNNVFVFIFCSLLATINLYVFDFVANQQNFWKTLLVFLVSTVGVFLFLMMKIVIINSSAKLFRISEFAPGQFYNFVRLLLACFTISSILSLLIFMLRGDFEPGQSILKGFLVSSLMVFWVVTFIKLNAKGGFTVFHLFSYLCASELIPIIILLNIYFS
jgi:hypothetical protein